MNHADDNPEDGQSVVLFAAGSLRRALDEAARLFEVSGGGRIVARYGASGLLHDAITAGTRADVFASANLEHPQSLAAAGLSEPVRRFAGNQLCALMRHGLALTPETLLTALLDPAIAVGTSTPKSDPSGDYAFMMFDRAEAIQPGAGDRLARKARRLTGAQDSARPPSGISVYAWHVLDGRADVFLTYRTNAIEACKQNPELAICDLPDNLQVRADYGLTTIRGAPAGAAEFADFILSAAGRDVLAGYGFSTPD